MSERSVQARLDITAIRAGVVRFGSGEGSEHCAVMEVVGAQQSLAKADDTKQEELLAAYAQFLNSLTFPLQLVVHVHPVDLAWYVRRVEERARSLRPALVAIARDHATYVQSLARQRTLLERRMYIAVSSSAEPSAASITRGTLKRVLRRTNRDGVSDDDRAFREQTTTRQLTDRCEAVERQLGRAGLRVTRLGDLALAQLYHVAWAPEVARTQRLRRELADYTALVTGAEPGAARRSGEQLA